MIRIGVDEAGYGPILGPLVVGGVAVRVPDGDGPSLHARLAGLFARAGDRAARTGGAAPADDSKAVHRRFGVEGLARGVSAFVAATGSAPPSDLADWLARFSDRGAEAYGADPWFFAPEEERWPAIPPPRGFAERVRLRGAAPLAVAVSPVTAAELNEMFAATGNKARVLFLVSVALLVRLLEAFPGEDVEAVLDREGGRLDYAGYLADAFPFREIEARAAPPGESAYSFREGGRRVSLSFRTRADGDDFAVGLASMAAKATRELFMARMNAWFSTRLPGLVPTAGYVEDGRRFLADVGPVIEREGIDRARLVRAR